MCIRDSASAEHIGQTGGCGGIARLHGRARAVIVAIGRLIVRGLIIGRLAIDGALILRRVLRLGANVAAIAGRRRIGDRSVRLRSLGAKARNRGCGTLHCPLLAIGRSGGMLLREARARADVYKRQDE